MISVVFINSVPYFDRKMSLYHKWYIWEKKMLGLWNQKHSYFFFIWPYYFLLIKFFIIMFFSLDVTYFVKFCWGHLATSKFTHKPFISKKAKHLSNYSSDKQTVIFAFHLLNRLIWIINMFQIIFCMFSGEHLTKL